VVSRAASARASAAAGARYRRGLRFAAGRRREVRPLAADHLGEDLAVDRDQAVLGLAADREDAGVGEDLEVVRRRRLAELDAAAQGSARQLTLGGDLLDHPEALGMGQGLEHADQRGVVHPQTVLDLDRGHVKSRPRRRGGARAGARRARRSRG
jgi:hypothetical protein